MLINDQPRRCLPEQADARISIQILIDIANERGLKSSKSWERQPSFHKWHSLWQCSIIICIATIRVFIYLFKEIILKLEETRGFL